VIPQEINQDAIDVMNKQVLIDLKQQKPDVFRQVMEEASNEELATVLYDWRFWARNEQLPPPGEWFTWLIMSGRGWGKTRTGAEWVNERVRSGIAKSIALVGDTAADVRDVMVEGPSGILQSSHPYERPEYEPSKRRLTWPNGATASCFAAESPESLRGPEVDTAWCDEPAKWTNLRKKDNEGGTAWDNLMYGLRAGSDPRCVATTTPRPIKWLKELIRKQSTITTGGSTYDNQANLARQYFENVIKPREGTRLGRQEIFAQLLEDVEGSLWSLSLIDSLRRERHLPLVRVVVAIDPSVTSKETSDECGIVVVGKDENDHGYLLEDCSKRCSPEDWARTAVEAFHRHNADRIIGEANNGGDMIESVLRVVDPNVPYRKVHASRSKQTRAEPVAALYEKGRVHHVGSFPQCEDEMATWVPGDPSPNRMDALVWGFTELMLGSTTELVLAV